MATTTTQVCAVNAGSYPATGGNDEYLRSLLLETWRRVDARARQSLTRRAAIAVLHDLGRNVANAYRRNDLLLAVHSDGAVDPATEWAIRECIRAINGPWARVQRAWNREMPERVM